MHKSNNEGMNSKLALPLKINERSLIRSPVFLESNLKILLHLQISDVFPMKLPCYII